MKLSSTERVLAAFLILAALSGFFVLTDDNSKVKTPEGPGAQPDKIASGERSLRELSGTSGNNIIQRIEVQYIPFESHEYWDSFETITIDVEEFENSASNGSVNLRLLERNFEVEIEEISRLNGGKSHRYSGHIKEIPQSKATFYVCGNLLSGSIEFEDLMYNIAVTSEVSDGKTVHTVFIMDWEKDRERLRHSLNPLRFIFASGSAGSSSEIKSCMIDENSVFEELVFDRHSFEVPVACEDFETMIVNPQRFRESASNGSVNLSLMGKHLKLKLKETNTTNSQTTYAGYIVGKPESSAVFAVGNDTIDGLINIDFYTLSYGVAATDQKYDGKVVHIICRYYNEDTEDTEDTEEKLEQKFSPDSLQFFLKNEDKKTHEISIEILDFYKEPMFCKTYSLNPGNEISFSEIREETGIYRYEITLDRNLTFEQEVRANYATGPGSSEKLHIDLIDHSEYPIAIGIESA